MIIILLKYPGERERQSLSQARQCPIGGCRIGFYFPLDAAMVGRAQWEK